MIRYLNWIVEPKTVRAGLAATLVLGLFFGNFEDAVNQTLVTLIGMALAFYYDRNETIAAVKEATQPMTAVAAGD